MGDEKLLHLLRRDVLPSSDDHVFDATDNLPVSVFQKDVFVSASIHLRSNENNDKMKVQTQWRETQVAKTLNKKTTSET